MREIKRKSLLKFLVRLHIMLACPLIMLSSCTTLTVQEMLPAIEKEKLTSVKETLRIGQIRSSEIKTDVMSRSIAPSGTIAPEVFAETLSLALEGSEIFAQIVTRGKADFCLDADIVSQEMSIGYPMTATLFIRYHLTDEHSGKIKWKKSIVSIGKSPASEVFRDRQKLANERAVKENLEKLLINLSAVLSTE